MIVEKAERIDVECVVRGYLAGSAWAEYRQVGTVHGEPMPKGLVQAEMLPEPKFTPAIKSDEGHDVNISNDELKDRIGGDLALSLQSASLKIYQFAAEFASARGLILADTKFEFGYIDGELRLIDELLTPDSSRFWDAGMYRTGESPPSFDKQYVRDWLSTQDWNRQSPGPTLPPDVVEGTQARYLEAYRRLTGSDLFLERFASVTSLELENSGHE